jgi:hypothetical protein
VSPEETARLVVQTLRTAKSINHVRSVEDELVKVFAAVSDLHLIELRKLAERKIV